MPVSSWPAEGPGTSRSTDRPTRHDSAGSGRGRAAGRRSLRSAVSFADQPRQDSLSDDLGSVSAFGEAGALEVTDLASEATDTVRRDSVQSVTLDEVMSTLDADIARRSWRYGGSNEARRSSSPEKQEHVQHVSSTGQAKSQLAHRVTVNNKIRRGSMESRNSALARFRGSEARSTTRMLHDVLEDSGNSKVVGMLAKKCGCSSLWNAVIEERAWRKSRHFEHAFPRTAAVVESAYFELGVGAVMAINGVMIGISVSADEELGGLEILEHACTAIFLAEVGVRLLVFGWIWIFSLLNFLDVLLIFVTGVLPMWILKPMGTDSSSIRILQVLRIVRLFRLIRTIRSHRAFRTPFKLAKGLLDSGRMICHSYAVIGTSLYIFAVFGVYFVGRNSAFQDGSPHEASDQAWPEARDLARESFYTVPESTFTLFQVMTLDSWTSVARPLMKYTAGAAIFLLVVIMVSSLVLQNLITAVIVNNALQCFSQDDEIQAAEHREKVEKELQDLSDIFRDFEDQTITRDDFLYLVGRSKALRNKLLLVDVGQSNARDFWDLLAEDRDEGMPVRRFAERMQTMQGEAKAKDSFATAQSIRHLNKRIDRLKSRLEDAREKAEAIQQEVKIVQHEFSMCLVQARQFAGHFGACVPARAVKCSEEKLRRQSASVYSRASSEA